VLIPHENEKDLVEIPKNIKDKLNIHCVKWVDEVLEHALVHMPAPADSKATPEEEAGNKSSDKAKAETVHAH
jgi:ATP-dependent Lon protease